MPPYKHIKSYYYKPRTFCKTCSVCGAFFTCDGSCTSIRGSHDSLCRCATCIIKSLINEKNEYIINFSKYGRYFKLTLKYSYENYFSNRYDFITKDCFLFTKLGKDNFLLELL
jgi:hypothetical protein